MYQRVFHHCFRRYLHNKTRLPELDFTKPMSDRLKKFSRNEPPSTDNQSLLKVSLRGQCLFGLYPIELALKAKRREFYQLFLSHTSNENRPTIENIQHLAQQLSIPIQHVNTNVLDRLAFDRPHQGVCLDCSPFPMEDITQTKMQQNPNRIFLDLCLVKIHDPMNLGAILRTAHFFGIDRIILTRGTCQPSPVASKASSGALEFMSIYTCHDLPTYLTNLREQEKNLAFICATHRGDLPLRILRVDDMKKNCLDSSLQRIILLIGNEHEGVPDELIQLCHYNVSIQPNTQSQISSLNASVACALFLYHISAQMNT